MKKFVDDSEKEYEESLKKRQEVEKTGTTETVAAADSESDVQQLWIFRKQKKVLIIILRRENR